MDIGLRGLLVKAVVLDNHWTTCGQPVDIFLWVVVRYPTFARNERNTTMKTSTTIPGWRGVEPPAIPISNFRRIPRWRILWRWLHTALALLGLFLLLAHSGPLLRLADPTAAVVDIGALSLVLLAVAALAAFLAVSRWLIGLLWPVLRDYRQHHFPNNFKCLLPWQKITFYLVIFFGLLYAFVVCLCAVF